MLFWSGDMECEWPPFCCWTHKDANREYSYVWGDTVAKAKTQCESLDYLFQLAVEMHKLGIPWIKENP